MSFTGYRLGDALYEDADSLHSDESGEQPDDSDEFADDEGMSNADSSSQVINRLLLQDLSIYFVLTSWSNCYFISK